MVRNVVRSRAAEKLSMTTRSKVLRTLVVLGVLACIAGAGVFSAFSSQTDNPGNVVTAGSVKLADNNSGSATYKLTNAKPGDSQTSCIQVTYTGTPDASVRLYTLTTIGPLGSSVNLKIEPARKPAQASRAAPASLPTSARRSSKGPSPASPANTTALPPASRTTPARARNGRPATRSSTG